MTWATFHRRGEVLRNVLEYAESNRDGVLPMGIPGVAETFGDEVTLLGALQLRWHTRLAGAIERELMAQPMDLEAAVISAWRKTATDLAGLRAILDAYTNAPVTDDMAQILDKAHSKDWTLMAAMAGKASPADARADRVGRAIEQKAREAYRPEVAPSRPGGHRRAEAAGRSSLLRRVKAHLAA